ncbi:MAG: hypothetical protein P8P74_16770 [Crocinitomicaceae bacterium]|nr:hypothetical protein [Crocinitomicaceae bacterium]
MKHYIALTSLLLLLITGSAHSQTISWSTTTDYDHNCSIQFPGVPANGFKNTSEGTKYTTFATYGQSSYILKVLDLKSEPSDKKAKAKKVLNSLASKMKGKVSEESDWEEGNNKGVKGKIEIAETGKPEMLIFCNVIVIGKTQYQVMLMTPKEIYDPAFDDHFLASFQFL